MSANPQDASPEWVTVLPLPGVAIVIAVRVALYRWGRRRGRATNYWQTRLIMMGVYLGLALLILLTLKATS